MSRTKKFGLLAIVLVAIAAAGWWALRAGDETIHAGSGGTFRGDDEEEEDGEGPDGSHG